MSARAARIRENGAGKEKNTGTRELKKCLREGHHWSLCFPEIWKQCIRRPKLGQLRQYTKKASGIKGYPPDPLLKITIGRGKGKMVSPGDIDD